MAIMTKMKTRRRTSCHPERLSDCGIVGWWRGRTRVQPCHGGHRARGQRDATTPQYMLTLIPKHAARL